MLTNLKDVDLPVTVLLCHSRVDEEAGVTELGDLPCQQLDSLRTIAEYYRLGNVKLREKRIQTVQLLLLLEVSVELSETLQREFVGESDELGVWHIFLLKVTDLSWVGGAEHENLLLGEHNVDDLLNNFSEIV